MNKLVSLYQEIATNIWDRIPFSYEWKFKYSEVTITENLLFDIHKFNINNPSLAINISEAKNEKANGNDLELCLEIEPDKYIVFVIQAKRIYKKDGKYKYPLISHKVNDRYQIDLLEEYAKRENAIPLYMLYSYDSDFTRKSNKYYGCSLIFSHHIRSDYYPKNLQFGWKIPTFNELHQKKHAVPLYALALSKLQLIQTIDKYHKDAYDFYTRDSLMSDNRWIEIKDKENQNYSSYTSDEFEPKYRLIVGINK